MPRFYKVQSAGFKVQMLCRIRDYIIYWIATPSAMARNDKRV